MRTFLIFLFFSCLFILPTYATTCELVRCADGTTCVEDCSGEECVASCVPLVISQEQTGCEAVTCEQGNTCVVDCSSGDCQPICKPIDVHITVCSLVRCPEGTSCVEDCSSGECFPSCVDTPTSPQSEPEFPEACLAVTCLMGSYCIVGDDGEPKCVSFEDYVCSSAQCPEGLRCVANQQECFTTPCPQYSCLQPGFDVCAHEGPANCPDMCPEIYAPVCASNGKTYSSGCKLTIENCNNGTDFTVLHQGECQEIPAPQNACDATTCLEGEICLEDPKYCLTTPCPQSRCVSFEACPLVKCSSEGEGVCGSDGVTYVNECQLNQTMCRELRVIYVKHLGECETSSSQDACNPSPCEASEVCLREQKYCITTPCPQYKCVPCSFCADACPEIYQPVCGEDGVSYSNECTLRAASCLERKVIAISHQGECETLPQAPQNACSTVDCGPNAICIEDPKDCSTFKKRRHNGHSHPSQTEGAGAGAGAEGEGEGEGEEGCQQYACYPTSQCPEMCPLYYQPFCASDGRTYGNQCELGIAICQQKRVITVLHEGPCNNQINLTITTTTEKHEVSAFPFDTILTVKQTLEGLTGIPPANQELSFQGAVLEDEETLEGLGIKGQAEFDLKDTQETSGAIPKPDHSRDK